MEYHRSEPRLSISDSLRSLDTFRAEFASRALPGVTLTLSDTKVLLKYLERDRKVVVTDRDVIKFVDEESQAEGARLVTQVDHGILEMKLAVDRLQEQIEGIHRQIDECVIFFLARYCHDSDFLVEQQRLQSSCAAIAKKLPCLTCGLANS